jgi:hypothetical protein
MTAAIAVDQRGAQIVPLFLEGCYRRPQQHRRGCRLQPFRKRSSFANNIARFIVRENAGAQKGRVWRLVPPLPRRGAVT